MSLALPTCRVPLARSSTRMLVVSYALLTEGPFTPQPPVVGTLRFAQEYQMELLYNPI